jgi:hypothetical protein
MAIIFSLSDHDGSLIWSDPGDSSPVVTAEEAQIIATAENAGAMRSVAHALYQIAEEIRDRSNRIVIEKDD